jgi:hypothetical protein
MIQSVSSSHQSISLGYRLLIKSTRSQHVNVFFLSLSIYDISIHDSNMKQIESHDERHTERGREGETTKEGLTITFISCLSHAFLFEYTYTHTHTRAFSITRRIELVFKEIMLSRPSIILLIDNQSNINSLSFVRSFVH